MLWKSKYFPVPKKGEATVSKTLPTIFVHFRAPALTVGMCGNRGHGVHGGIGNVLDVDGDVPLPHADALVVRRRDHSPAFVNKTNGVDGTQVAAGESV